MSHWKKFNSKVLENVDMNMLAKALKEMGLGLNTSARSVSNTFGRDSVDAAITDAGGRDLSLGIKMKDGKLTLTGDFYGTGLNEAQFIDKLAMSYQANKIQEGCTRQGWNVDIDTVDADGNRVIEAYQWV